MSDVKATEPTVAQPAVEQPAVASSTQPTAVTDPTPDVSASADVIEPTTALPVSEEAPVATEKKEAAIEPIHSGALGYKAPGLLNRLHFSKRYFWFGDEAVSSQHMSHYLRGEKPEVAHPVVAWSSQTGKGLLYFVKHADQKTTPSGVINTADITELKKEGMVDFSFKLHGEKHTFQTSSTKERDGWFLAFEKTSEEAKAAKEGIFASEGYKETIAHLDKPATLAVAGDRTRIEGSTPKKSTDIRPAKERASSTSSSSSDDEAKKAKKSKSKSRSVSRGKRGSVFGALLGKKEEHDEKKEIKKEEKAEKKVEAEAIKEESKHEEAPAVVAGTAAPIDAAAVAERVLGAPVDAPTTTETAATEPTPAATAVTNTEPTTAPVETPKATAAAPKPTKRGSIFGNFFEKVRSPTHEKKEADLVPPPVKETETTTAPVSETAPVIPESTETKPVESIEPVAATAPVVEPTPVAETKPEVTTPTKEHKESFFGKFLKGDKKENKIPEPKPTETKAPETTPAVAAAEESKGEAPVVAPVAETPAITTSATANTPEPVKDKRRSSFFGLGSVRKEKKSEGLSDTENGEHKKSGLGGLFRNPSKAVKSKETKPETAVAAESTETPVTSTDAPVIPPQNLSTETDAVVADKPTEEPVTNGHQSVGDATPSAVAVGQAPQPGTAVHATA